MELDFQLLLMNFRFYTIVHATLVVPYKTSYNLMMTIICLACYSCTILILFTVFYAIISSERIDLSFLAGFIFPSASSEKVQFCYDSLSFALQVVGFRIYRNDRRTQLAFRNIAQ